MFAGSKLDNMRDMAQKGRHFSKTKPERLARGEKHGTKTKPDRIAKGERHGMAKLTDQQVRDIRANWALCRVTQRALGERYGVTQAHVSLLVKGYRQ